MPENIRHIDSALTETTKPMMYQMHKWAGRKPSNIWAEYIKKYSKPGEIVLDPFCGSGIAPIESIICGRKGIGFDLNPMAIFLTHMLSKHIDANLEYKIRKMWEILKDDFRKFERKTNLYYTKCSGFLPPNCTNDDTKCSKCGKLARIINFRYKNTTELERIAYKCDCTKDSRKTHGIPHPELYCLVKDADQHDKEKISKLNSNDFSELQKNFIVCKKMSCWYWHPTEKLPHTDEFENVRNSYGGDTYDILHPKHSLFSLSYMYYKINLIDDLDIRNFFKISFTSILHLLTKVPVARNTPKTCRFCSVSMGRLTFLYASNRVEPNPIMQFERSMEESQGFFAAKIFNNSNSSSNQRIQNKIHPANSFSELVQKNNEQKNFFLKKLDVFDLSTQLPENSIDYIITDPPYGGLVPYFDLTTQWTVWLKGIEQDKFFSVDFSKELTIDNERSFDLIHYQRYLIFAFSEIFKVLKPGKYMHVTFHNKDIAVFNSLITACRNAGFVLDARPILQINARAGETGVSNPRGTAVADFYFRFHKPVIPKNLKKLPTNKFEKYVIEEISKIIAQRGQPTELLKLLPTFLDSAKVDGYDLDFESEEQITTILEKTTTIFHKITKNNFSFWWLTSDYIRSHKLEIPLDERIPKAIIATLRRSPTILDEILDTIFRSFPDTLTPEKSIIQSIDQVADYDVLSKKWKLKSFEDQIARQDKTLHLEKQLLLSKLGKSIGYDVWCPKPDKTRLPELRKFCLQRFPFSTLSRAEPIKLIDVLWIKGQKIEYAFEVENSTSITSALERCSNLPDSTTQKIIVLPKQRKNFFDERMKNPFFYNFYKNGNWKKIWYDDLDSFTGQKINDIMK